MCACVGGSYTSLLGQDWIGQDFFCKRRAASLEQGGMTPVPRSTRVSWIWPEQREGSSPFSVFSKLAGALRLPTASQACFLCRGAPQLPASPARQKLLPGQGLLRTLPGDGEIAGQRSQQRRAAQLVPCNCLFLAPSGWWEMKTNRCGLMAS